MLMSYLTLKVSAHSNLVDVGLAARYRQKIILYAMKVAHVPSYYFFLQPVVVFKRKCEG